MLIRLLFLAALAVIGWYLFGPDPSISYGPGVRAPDEPLQTKTADARELNLNGYRIKPLADFRIRAKVLGREDYMNDREADLAPMDLALGWGRMSDEAVLESINISQSNRWYHWRSHKRVIPRKEIETHSANMHLIPIDNAVGDRMDAIVEGQIVEISGQLVRVDADDGWRWVSSLTRKDTGSRSCEVILVRHVRSVE